MITLFNKGERKIDTKEGALLPNGQLNVSDKLGTNLIKLFAGEVFDLNAVKNTKDASVKSGLASNAELSKVKAENAQLAKKIGELQKAISESNSKISALVEENSTLSAQLKHFENIIDEETDEEEVPGCFGNKDKRKAACRECAFSEKCEAAK